MQEFESGLQDLRDLESELKPMVMPGASEIRPSSTSSSMAIWMISPKLASSCWTIAYRRVGCPKVRGHAVERGERTVFFSHGGRPAI